MKKPRLKLTWCERQHLKELRRTFKRMSKELETAKIVLRDLLKSKTQERSRIYHLIYDLEKKGGKKSDAFLRNEMLQKKEEEVNAQFLANLEASRERWRATRAECDERSP